MMKTPDFVYRLVTAEELATSLPAGDLPLRDIDKKDGYVHLSCRDQLIETADLHFSDYQELHAVAFRPEDLGESFGWHAALTRGADFPHVVGALNLGKSDHIKLLRRGAGGFRFDEGQD